MSASLRDAEHDPYREARRFERDAAYTCSIANGAHPMGLTLAAGGIISGTPTQAEVTQLNVRVVDSATPPIAGSTPLLPDRALTLAISAA